MTINRILIKFVIINSTEMKLLKLISVILFFELYLVSLEGYAQFKIDVFSSIAVNPIERPCLITAGFTPGYEYKGLSLDYSMDININHRETKVINAFAASMSYKFNIKNNPLKISVFYCNKPISQMLQIHNTGLKFKYEVKKWEFTLGNNFNIYRFTNDAADTYNINDNQYLVESANIMYSVKYYIMQPLSLYNFYINLTNFELFIIEQETNPMLNVGFIWKKNNNWPKVFVDYWYQSAGFNNIRVNYFGWLTRIGVQWDIK